MQNSLRGFFDYDGPLAHFFQLMFELILLNVLFIACCVPVITAGASLLALNCTCREMQLEKKRDHIGRVFWQSFRKNLTRGMLLTGILGVLTFLLWYDYAHLMTRTGTVPLIFFGMLCAATLLILMLLVYLFPVLSDGKRTLRQGVCTAFSMSFACFPRTILMILLNFAPAVLFFLYPQVLLCVLPICCLFACSVLDYWIWHLLEPVWQENIRQEKEKV